MKVQKIQLKNFKRFDDLTIDLGENPKKIIALVGPNGCGKSSIFDAFEEKQKNYKNAKNTRSASFFSKLFYSIFEDKQTNQYNRNESISIELKDGEFNKKSFYIRSSYRFTSKLNVKNIKSLPDIIDDENRPSSSVDLDTRLQENYERLLGKAWYEFQHGSKSGIQMRNELIGNINDILSKIVEIKITDLGDVVAGKGQLYFEKGNSKNFPYENLSSGEKEVVDIIIDLVVKKDDFNETIYCIDEPELHLNTSIQRKLLIEIDKLIPDSCQLWVATHSIGFLRAIQDELKEKSQVLDFSEKNYFDDEKNMIPISQTRENWKRIFETALEDLTGLLSPKTIIYCEGRQDPSINGDELGLDANVYNEIFAETHNDTLFVSSGGGGEVSRNTTLALKVLSKAFNDVNLLLLRDRDEKTDQERDSFLQTDVSNRMLIRREIENYLFDKGVLKKYCESKGVVFDENRYDQNVEDISTQDLKLVQQEIKTSCSCQESMADFKLSIAEFITKDTDAYRQLEQDIFNN